VGVTAGASWPEELVQGVLNRLEAFGWIFDKEIKITLEKMEFPYTLQVHSN
jgi:4-hydroxy-3-methylbut-2-enyl diphosphate reductase IspH